MKRKRMCIYLGLVAAAVMGMSVPSAAEETEDPAVLAGSETEDSAALTESETETLQIAGEFKFWVGGTEIVVANEGKIDFNVLQVDESDPDDGEEGSCTMILTTEGRQHKFEDVTPGKWTDPALVEDHGFLYIRYTDAEGNSKEALETAEAVVPEEELTMWAVTDVNMRREASADSEVAAVVGLSGECKVLSILPGWYQVEYSGETGYINHKFLSDDKEAVDAAVKQEEAAVAAAEAAAAAQRNSANSYSFSGSGSGKSSGKGKSKSQEECLTNGLLN